MATLTALRRTSADRVELEVDGRPWRIVPDDVVVRCGLHAGRALDRPLLRQVRTELRRAEALAMVGRALAHTQPSRRRLRERLRRRGVTPPAERAALRTLAELGLLDDGRLAQARANTLAERGWGDLAIEARLEREGFEEQDVRCALAELPRERDRAAAVAAKLARPRRSAWGALSRRGFSGEAIEDALGPLDVDGEAG